MRYLINLLESYIGQTLAPIFAVLFTALITGGEDFDAEVIILMVPIVTNFYAYSPTFILTVLYLITGSDWLLVYWLDDVLIFLIEHWISNYNVFIMFFTFVVLLRALTKATNSTSYIITALLYGL